MQVSSKYTLLKKFLEETMNGELEAYIEEQEERNRKNGKGRKQGKTPVGIVEFENPRDRIGTFEPVPTVLWGRQA